MIVVSTELVAALYTRMSGPARRKPSFRKIPHGRRLSSGGRCFRTTSRPN